MALRSWLLPDLRGAAARLAEIVLCIALLVLTLELLGAIGLFRLVPILVSSALVGVGLWALLRRGGTSSGPAGGHDRAIASSSFPVGISLGAAGVVLAEWAGPTLQSYDIGIRASDSVAYHLPWAASFAQTGQITGIRYTDFDWFTGFYPATAELLHGLGIVLMGNDVLSPAINLLWLGLVLLAAWCVGAPRGLGPATLLAGVLVMGTPMMFFSTAGTANSDVAATFFVVAAVALLINADRIRAPLKRGEVDLGRSPGATGPPPGARAALPAAAAAGLALSVKLNVIPAVFILTATVIAYVPAQCRRRATGLWIATVGLTGGFWYLRNLVAVGNPLPYFSFGILPTPRPPPMQAHTNFAVFDYLTYPRIVTKFFERGLAQGLGPWWTVIMITAVAGSIFCICFGRNRLARFAGLVGFASLLAYALTPGTASGPWGHPYGFALNLRYAAPALCVSLMAIPLAAPLARRRARFLVAAALAAMVAATVAQDRLWGADPPFDLSSQIVAALLVLVVGAALIARPWASFRDRQPVIRLASVLAVLALTLTGIAFGYSGHRHYLRGRYADAPRVRGIPSLWRWARHIDRQRIALTGTFGWFFGYPLFGLDDSNHVVYLGQRLRSGAFRPISTCVAWRAALNTGHFNYVVITGMRMMWTGAILPTPEGEWTKTDPAAKLVFPPGRNVPVGVYAIRGRLNPSRCGSVRRA